MNDIFENNKQNLLLINEIVANYRKQNFFVGSLKLSALLKNINSVVEVIFSREDCRDLAGELEQILPALLQAQGNLDYILQADILEGVAYTLQIIGQKGMNPTVASLILSLESVVSVIAGFLILHQTLSLRELIGCVLMFAAIILVQLPDRAKK